MSTSIMSNDRLVDLLVQRATEGLSAAEQMQLSRLLANTNYTDTDQFDETAAALTLAGLDDEPLPDSLKTRLQKQADTFVVSSPALVTPIQSQQQSAPRTSPETSPKTSAKTSSSGKVAWFAAAACAVLAITGWWPRLQDNRDADTWANASGDMETLAKARERLLAQTSVLRREWKPTEDPAARNVTGDIVWDEKAQIGYMRFRGLPTNDPQELQYQLWIFDTTRGDQYPVDGGVFNIPATETGEVVVPIFAKLPIRNPALFAVTIEKPGGSVVSSRERIVVVAPIAAG